MQKTLKQARKKKPKMLYSNESTKVKKNFPFDHLLFRTKEFTIQPTLVISFIISFKKTRMLRFCSGKNGLMMMDKGKES